MIDLFLGRRGLGKTTLACHVAKSFAPRLTIDPRFQFAVDAVHSMTDVDPESVLFSLEQGEDVVVQPRDRQAAVDALAWCAERYILSEIHSRRLAVIFDEAKLYDVKSWEFLMVASPIDRASFLFTAHRPKDISPDLRSLANRWFIFRTVQEHDLEVILERCGPRVCDRVQKLQPYEYVVWNDDKSEALVNTSPATWYTPLDTGARV